jgi:hypothetical protein
VEEGSEELDAVDEAGAGAGEVGGGVDGPDLGPRGGEVLEDGPRLRDGAGEVVAAGHEDGDVGAGCADGVPVELARGLAGAAEHLGAAGCGDHVGHPVPAGEGRIRPLQARDPRRLPAGRPPGDLR